MRIAIVGAGPAGLAAAHLLSQEPRHEITVFETRAWFSGPVDGLIRLGVRVRHTAQVERFVVRDDGADLYVHGLPDRFDLAFVMTSGTEARALLARSGLTRRDAYPRVHFAEDATAARVRALVRHVDLSGQCWPLEAPAVFIANRHWVLGGLQRRLGAGVAFVVDGGSAAAAVAALAVNAPIVPLAASLRRPRTVVVGELFYAETSSIEELMHDMRMVLRHLERLATSPSGQPA
jgi:hypothetical protein